MPADPKEINWLRFAVRFAFGTLFGVAAGIHCAVSIDDAKEGFLVIAGCTGFFGLVAGCYGDGFWESFRNGSFLNPFRWF